MSQMSVTEIRYVEAQMEQVAPFPILDSTNGQFRLKITSDRGQTNWMNISNEQFSAIESILLGVVTK